MSELEFDVRFDDPPGFRADAVLNDAAFEVLLVPRDLRALRSRSLDIARWVSGGGRRRGILVLEEPFISEDRIMGEWQGLHSILKSRVSRALSLVLRREDKPCLVVGHLSSAEDASLDAVVRHARTRAFSKSRRRAEAFFDVLRVLLIHWFRRSGPLTSKRLSEESGYSYPTIAKALEKLAPYLHRHSDRRVELRSFPQDAWLQLIAQPERVRPTYAYTDSSGRPRSPDALLGRLRELRRPDIAVAGVLGARHYLPGLDLIGTPRLDLVLHSHRPGGERDIVRRLDPALKPAKRGEPIRLAIHALHRPASFFEKDGQGDRYADEVECLLDLHDARLEALALEFLQRLAPKEKS